MSRRRGLPAFVPTALGTLRRPLNASSLCRQRGRPFARQAVRSRLYARAPTVCAIRGREGQDAQARIAEALLAAGRFAQSSTGQIVLWAGLVWLVLTGRIGVLFDSFLILFAVVSVVPVVAVLAFRWWVNRQLVQGECPSCGTAVTGLRGQPFQCMNCGNVVQGENQGDFSVNDPSSATIDIDAKEID